MPAIPNILQNVKTNVQTNLFTGGALGVDNLSDTLTINGTTVTPFLRYKGGDANSTNWAKWGYGDTVTLQAGTAPTYNNGSPGVGPNDDSVKFNGGGYYKKTNYGHITTEDWAFEAIVKITGSAEAFAGDWVSGGAGWLLWEQAGAIKLRARGAGAEVDTVSATKPAGTWLHVMAFGNVDEASTNGSIIYLNGVAGVGSNVSTVGDMTNTNALSFGALNTGSLPSNGNIAYFAAYKQASWHKAGAAGPAEWAALALSRYDSLIGFVW